ncbi:MAG: perosamine synthetase [Rhodospirillaceae bacterium]|nr:perosamine synthetase [Rhodospirillaceae bacterium]|tara:strand:+ start:1799 stop:2950 length:1152 start_codon:yes stop_codon:yes gene_type:complete
MNYVKGRTIQISEPVTGKEELDALSVPLETGWLTQGPKVKEFENHFANMHSTKFAFATTSCTTSLHLALSSIDIMPGDEVIVPAFTWVSTANVVVYCGAKPVFVDVRADTYNIDFEKIKDNISSKTKAIIPVHLFGLCADMDEINSCLPKGVKVIEDAACAVGASYKNRMSGSLGDFGAFSFHPRKIITTGEGGMITTNDEYLAKKAEILRNHGASISEEKRHQGAKPYLLPDFDVLGFNYRMTDLQGAVGLAQLGKLDNFLSERKKWAEWYLGEISDIPWINLPNFNHNYDHSWQAFVVVIDEEKSPFSRNEIMEKLLEAGISTRPGTHAVTNLGYYRDKFRTKKSDFPVATMLEDCSLALPLHNKMDIEDFEYISKIIHSI